MTAARYLPCGTYTVTFQHRAVSGKPPGAVQYSLFLLEVTDGVGPYAPGASSPPPSSSSGGSTTSSGGYTYSGSSSTRPSGNYYYF